MRHEDPLPARSSFPDKPPSARELVINVKQIPQKGLMLETEVSPQALELEQEDFRFPEPLKVSLLAAFASREILVQGRVTTAAKAPCSRCMTPVVQSVHIPELVLSYPYTGQDFLDLSLEIRDEILLALPSRMLCRPDCRGLCPQCRINLNSKSCACAVQPAHSPFDGLKLKADDLPDRN